MPEETAQGSCLGTLSHRVYLYPEIPSCTQTTRLTMLQPYCGCLPRMEAAGGDRSTSRPGEQVTFQSSFWHRRPSFFVVVVLDLRELSEVPPGSGDWDPIHRGTGTPGPRGVHSLAPPPRFTPLHRSPSEDPRRPRVPVV